MVLDNFRTIELIWDKASKSIIKTIITASSDTTGRYLSVKILDGGQEVILNSASLQLYWEHPNFNTSGVDFFNVVNNSGLFKMTFSEEMLTNVGELNAYLVLTLPDGKITSDGFPIEVIKGANSGVVVPSSGNILFKLIDRKIDKGNVGWNDLSEEVKTALTSGDVSDYVNFADHEARLEDIERELQDLSTSKPITDTELTSLVSGKNVYTSDENDVYHSTNGLYYLRDKIFLNTSKIQFVAKRQVYWIIVGGTSTRYSVLGLSTENTGGATLWTHQLADFNNDSLVVRYEGNSFTSKVSNMSLSLDDTVEIENTDLKIIVRLKKSGAEVFSAWFEVNKAEFPLVSHFGSNLGFVFGIGGTETHQIANPKVMLGDLRDVNKFGSAIETLYEEVATLDSTVTSLVEDVADLSGAISTQKKHAIVIVAGQSNAVGYDESPVEYRFSYHNSSRVKQIGFKGENNLKIIELDHSPEDLQDMSSFSNPLTPEMMGTKSVHLPLGNELLKHIPEDYDVLFIPIAFGGTGFTIGTIGTYNSTNMKPSAGQLTWSATSPYYLAMRDRLKYALDLNENNVFLGTIWIQGENDNPDPTGHWAGFTAMTKAFFDYFNQNGYGNRVKKGTFDKDIWYNVESTEYWKTLSGYNTILANYNSWNGKTYVPIPTDTDTNVVNGTGATASNREAHFGNNAYYKVIAPAIMAKMIENDALF